jgi:hypothetical protein
MLRPIHAACAMLPLVLSACASAPDFRTAGVDYHDEGSGIPIQEIVDHIACEIHDADKAQGGALSRGSYAAVATFNLKVDDTGGLAPSLSFFPIVNMMKLSNAPGYGISGQLTEAREHTYSQTVAFNTKTLASEPSSALCAPDAGGVNLSGDLKIGQVVAMGLQSVRQSQAQKGSPPEPAWVVKPVTPNATSVPGGSTTASPFLQTPAFGTSIQFVLTKAIGGGPNWVLREFKGPSGTSNLVNYSRMDTQQVIIAFSPPNVQTGVHLERQLSDAEIRQNDETSAVSSALGVVNNMQLQQINRP